MSIYDKLVLYAKKNYNVLLIGRHGIGKSEITLNVVKDLGLKYKYYSSSTLDPFADLVGIPVPDAVNNTLKFYKPEDLKSCEFLFFDELNRAHPRVLNAILEIIQFKTVNGERLPNLKMVWAAINPPGETYQVEDLDPALIDRFHVYLKMKPEINVDYFSSKLGKQLAKTLSDWWDNDLDETQKQYISPRRMEYIGLMIKDSIDFRDAIPQGHTFPLQELENRVKHMNNSEEEVIVNKENVLKNVDLFLKKSKEDPRISIKLSNIMTRFSSSEIFECRDIIESMPKELVLKISKDRFNMVKREILNLFVLNKIDIKKYPKIEESFGKGL